MGNAAVFQRFQNQLQSRQPFQVGFADDDGGVDAGQGQCTFVLELDRSRAIDKGERIAEKLDISHVEADAHAMVASFGTGVADGALVGDSPLSADAAGPGENGFEQRRFAGEIRAYQCNAAAAAARCRAAGWIFRIPHGVLLCRSSRITGGGWARRDEGRCRAPPRLVKECDRCHARAGPAGWQEAVT